MFVNIYIYIYIFTLVSYCHFVLPLSNIFSLLFWMFLMGKCKNKIFKKTTTKKSSYHLCSASSSQPAIPSNLICSSYSTAGAIKLIPSRALCLFSSFQLRPRQPGERSSLLISDLNSSIKFKGGAENQQTLCPPWNELHTCCNVFRHPIYLACLSILQSCLTK